MSRSISAFLCNLIALSPAQAGPYPHSYSKKSKADYEHEYDYESVGWISDSASAKCFEFTVHGLQF